MGLKKKKRYKKLKDLNLNKWGGHKTNKKR